MSLLDNMPHRCTIASRRRSKEVDGIGVAVDRFSIVSQNVPCWEQSISSEEAMEMMKRSIDAKRKVYFPENPGLNEGHVIIITERLGTAIPEGSQQILDVLGFFEPDASAGMGILFKAICDYRTGSTFNASEVSII